MMAYRAGDGHKHEHRAGEPFCTNCNKPGHWIMGCLAKGGGAEGKGPRQKKKQKKRDSEKKNKKKDKEKANQVVQDKSDNKSEHSDTSTWPPPPIHLHILNSAGSSMAVLPPTYAKTDRHLSTSHHVTTLSEASTRELRV